MAAVDFARASQQTSLMLQKVNKDVKLSENLDKALDSLFSDTPAEEIGLQQYRHPIQVATGGVTGYYQPDGGAYFQGNGPQNDQMIVAPLAILAVWAATELARRISNGGSDVTIDNWVAKMISGAKNKVAHTRNGYLQGYNTGVLATITGVAGTTATLASSPFGGRLLDKGNYYQITDANYNVVGTAQAQDVFKNGITNDSVVFDNIPGGVGAGYLVLPIGLATGNPVAIAGLNYIVSPSAALEYFGISRANSYVQSPGYNANGSTLTLGATETFKTRMMQALGEENYSDRSNNVFYGHGVHRMSANIQGFAKQMFVATDGKAQNFDPYASMKANESTLAGMKFVTDTMAAIDKLYWLDKSTLRKVRYPGSQKFIPGPIEGMFWPRMAGGQWTSEWDVMYQDSVNYYSSLPWANGVIYGLGLQPALSNQ